MFSYLDILVSFSLAFLSFVRVINGFVILSSHNKLSSYSFKD